jgi:hypothetical protein
LLVRHRRIVGDVGDSLLEILAGGKSAPPGTYGATVRRFEEDPTAWYSSRGTGRAGIASARPLDPDADALKAKIVRLQKKMVDMQDRVRRRDEQIARLTGQLAARTSAKG